MGHRFVGYLRVITDRQGRSGLGLEAQGAAVAAHPSGGVWTLIDGLVKIERQAGQGRRSTPVGAERLPRLSSAPP